MENGNAAPSDIALGVLAFRNGAVGIIEASTAVYSGLPERIEITGTGGTVIVEPGEVILRQLKDEQGETPPYGAKARATRERGQAAASADPAAISHVAHRRQLADLLEALDTGRDPLVTGEEARKTLEIILAVYESARTGREVALPLVTGTS